MGRPEDSGHLDLTQVLGRVQSALLSELKLAINFEHPTAAGTASELPWTRIFNVYLPRRYRAAPAFVVNKAGDRSRQIDIVIYDNFFGSPVYAHEAGDHIPIESVFAVFEVKGTLNAQWITDAGQKAASVRELAPNQPILAGALATTSSWHPDRFSENLTNSLSNLEPEQLLTHICALEHGSYIPYKTVQPERALATFLFSLITTLNNLPCAIPELMDYLR